MNYFDITLMGIGLAMDAFAVSICKGIKMKELKKRNIFIIALFFGGFQMLMPLIGWLLGTQLVDYIREFDHWISFGLLAFIGIKMCIESFKKEDGEKPDDGKLNIKELFLLAIATSIDALAVGIAFAFSDEVKIIPSISIIGAVTFLICTAGVVIGNKFGAKFKSKAEFLGGLVLTGIGIKLLIEGLLEMR